MLPCQKHLFSLPDDAHYLNGAYMSPLLKSVEEAGIRGMAGKRMPSSIKAADFFETSDSVRRLFAGLTGADALSVALIPSASYGIATVAKNLNIEQGLCIIVVDEQFPSNVYAWLRIAAENGASVVTIAPPETTRGRGKAWNERILEAIDHKVAAVALPHVHWADGTRFDLESIGRRARDVGAALIVDGTQSVGALPFDVQRIQPDALICAGYKWLLGPYSTGVAYYGPRFSNSVPLEENWITRKNSEHFGGLVQYVDAYQPGSIRFDVGERSNFILLPMLEAALMQLTEWKIDQIQAYCTPLVREFVDYVRASDFMVEEEPWRANHLFGVRVRKDISTERLIKALEEAKISVSIRGNAVRISPNVYNDANDMAAISTVFERMMRTASV